MPNLSSNSRVLIIGATGGIGHALTIALGNICGIANVVTKSRSADGLDICDEQSIRNMVGDLSGEFDLILIASGAFTLGNSDPEETIQSWQPEALRGLFEINAIGPAMLIKHLYGFLRSDQQSILVTLSSYLGSISENKSGNWVSYRTTKAATNQIVKTAAIDIAKENENVICVALHPGVVLTDLSRDYVDPADTISPAQSATEILKVLQKLKPSDNGAFYDYTGDKIPW